MDPFKLICVSRKMIFFFVGSFSVDGRMVRSADCGVYECALWVDFLRSYLFLLNGWMGWEIWICACVAARRTWSNSMASVGCGYRFWFFKFVSRLYEFVTIIISEREWDNETQRNAMKETKQACGCWSWISFILSFFIFSVYFRSAAPQLICCSVSKI